MKALESDLIRLREEALKSASVGKQKLSDIRRIAGNDAQRLKNARANEFKAETAGTRNGNSRIEEVCGRWFFQTREGTTEGPFATRETAQTALDAYLAIARSASIDQHALGRINGLSLEPLN